MWKIVLLFVVITLIIQEHSTYGNEQQKAESGENTRLQNLLMPKRLYRWMVALVIEKDLACSATIISDRLVLTAAHCFFDKGEKLKIESFVGHAGIITINMSSPVQKLYFNSVHIHPKYDSKLNKNDIAVMVTKKKISFNKKVKNICIAKKKETETAKNRVLIGMGFGSLENSDSLKLKKIELREDRSSKCPKDKMCARIASGKLVAGDSGGPLISMRKLQKPLQVGVYFGTENNLQSYEKISNHQDFIGDLAKKMKTKVCFKS